MTTLTVRTMPIVVVPADAEVDLASVHRLLRESIAALDPHAFDRFVRAYLAEPSAVLVIQGDTAHLIACGLPIAHVAASSVGRVCGAGGRMA